MSKRKGMSAEEKRNVILSIYHECKEPFNLKEIEQRGTKRGVVTQTIKDVNQSLVDDFLVMSDKIGAANFFWSFPSKTFQDQVTQKETFQMKIQQHEQSLREINEKENAARLNRCDPLREQKLQQLAELTARESILDKQLESLKYNDPKEIQKVKDATKLCQSAAERWTDNIWTIKSYLTRKKGMASKEADNILRIDSSFDYPIYEPNIIGSKKRMKK